MYQQILKNRLEKKIIPFLPSKIKNLKDEHKKLSYAFLIFSLITILDITIEEAIPLVTEGQDDKGIDAIFIDDNNDITFFQSKYFQKHSKKIGENEVIKLSSTIDSFLIKMEEINGNKALTIKLKEIKKILKNELSSPKITTVFISNNTECLEKKAEDILKNIQKIESKRHYIGYTLSNLFNLLETNKIDFDFTFTAKGSGYSDDFGGIKSYTINLPAKELIRLYKEGGEANVLSKNIRFFIGKSRINKKIQETAIDPVFSDFFWFFNNGISIITDSIEAPNYWNDIDAKSRKIKLKNPQIINGGQTTRALYDLFEKEPTLFSKITEEKVFILTRIYQTDDSTIIDKITEGTNSQNAIFFRDLKANNKIQKIVASYFK
ncbi:MAG: AIPR family protein, partial [Alphaproteobacteria bacterium]